MFIFTAKFDKQKLIAAIMALIIIIAVIALITTKSDTAVETYTSSLIVKNNDQRISYLESFGWEVSEEPIEQQTVIIPKDFSEVYQEYNKLQIKQGFDLTDYAGMEAERYTYQILNYPSSDSSVVADIIVYRNRVIAGDIQSVSMNGFMSELNYPN